MTKKKLSHLVNKSFNLFVRKAQSLKLGTKLWDYTWVSIATAKKKRFKVHSKSPLLEKYLQDLLDRLTKKRPIKINYTHSCGANYKCIYAGPKATDWINIPCIKRFKSRNYYYKTIFHELCHCMMERLIISQRIDNTDDEEIASEFSAMILSVLLGINAWKESYKYVGDYLLNNEGYLIHKGRRDYIKQSVIQLLEYVLKLK